VLSLHPSAYPCNKNISIEGGKRQCAQGLFRGLGAKEELRLPRCCLRWRKGWQAGDMSAGDPSLSLGSKGEG
jgi:hypothetical protein